MKITVGQLNPTIGDFQGNLEKLYDALKQASRDCSDLLVLPELYLTGYPPRDLLERSWFIRNARKALNEVVKYSSEFPEIGIIVGLPTDTVADAGVGLHNSAALVHNGEVLHLQHKSLLPTYDVFDEARYFDPAGEISTTGFKDEVLGITICEDAWNDSGLWMKRHYELDPVETLAKRGATIMINISASPFYIGKESLRFKLVSSHAKKHGVPFVFVNQVGANDELVFDGRSLFVDKDGNAVEVFPLFREEVRTIDTGVSGETGFYVPGGRIESVHDALVLGIRDYMSKCGFRSAVISLSGGIDSAVTAALAVRAVGAENVTGVTLPSPFSSAESVSLSEMLASNLKINFGLLPIEEIYNTYRDGLAEYLDFKRSGEVDVTLENIQARIRGNIVMALSNKYGHLVLSTGNKSEFAVGYCTLYGDMSGGLAVISDVPKTMVYEVAEFINRDEEVIPRRTIEKVPSAELRPDQKDQDTLPEYAILDEILMYYVDEGMSIDEIIGKGHDEATVRWVVRAVNRNEYKRLQAAPGIKVTSKAFGMGRRMPIAAKYES